MAELDLKGLVTELDFTTALLLFLCFTLPIILYLYAVQKLVGTPSIPTVISVALSTDHAFTKQPVQSISLLPGLGIEGDCHLGRTVQHRSRLHIRPLPLNLRQCHLIQSEVLSEFNLKPSDIGENVTTVGIDLLALGKGAKLHFLPAGIDGDRICDGAGKHPVIVITGLRNPCPQIEKFRTGLQEKFIERDAERKIVARKAGVMSTIEVGGIIEKGMRIILEKPADFVPLECV